MTLINLSKQDNSRNISFLLVGLLVVASGMAVALVYQYNQVVNIQFEVKEAKGRIDTLVTSNADLNTTLLNTISPENLDSTLESMGLIREARPQYHTLEKADVVAQSF